MSRYTRLSGVAGPHNLVEGMLRSKANWSAINVTETAIKEKSLELDKTWKAVESPTLSKDN